MSHDHPVQKENINPEEHGVREGNEAAMSEELKALIERARNHKMTTTEAIEQEISSVYGNLRIENPHITREQVALTVRAIDRHESSR